MNGLFTSIFSVLLFFGLLVSASSHPGPGGTPPLNARYFKVLIKTPGNTTLDGKYHMDIKDGVMGFGRGGDIFEAVSYSLSFHSRVGWWVFGGGKSWLTGNSISTGLSKATPISLRVKMVMGSCWKMRLQDTTFRPILLSLRLVFCLVVSRTGETNDLVMLADEILFRPTLKLIGPCSKVFSLAISGMTVLRVSRILMVDILYVSSVLGFYWVLLETKRPK